MPRDPIASEVQQNLPELFAAKAKAYGTSVDDLTDAEHKAVGDEALAELAQSSTLPEWIQKLQEQHITDADLLQFATSVYDMPAAEALAKYRSDVLKAHSGVEKKSTSPFGKAF